MRNNLWFGVKHLFKDNVLKKSYYIFEVFLKHCNILLIIWKSTRNYIHDSGKFPTVMTFYKLWYKLTEITTVEVDVQSFQFGHMNTNTMTQVTNFLKYIFWINYLILEARSQCLILINLNKNKVIVCDLFSHVQHFD